MKAQHDQLNVILMTDELSPVRRFSVTRQQIRMAAAVAGVFVFLLSAGVVDYVRLRIDAVDVAALRAKTSAQQSELADLAGQVGTLSVEFAGLRELERKVRVIANLPGAVDEARVPVPTGRGGNDEPRPPGELQPEQPPTRTRTHPGTHPGPAHADPEAQPPTALRTPRSGAFDTIAMERASRRARILATAVVPSQQSLAELVAGLEGKRHQLESTPSIWPTDGWVTSRYGTRTSPFTGKPQFHAGLDIAAAFGTPILAPARGRVSFVGKKGPLGRAVIIDHGFGLKTTYGHTSKTYVARGEVVERGTPIAAVGSTGRSTGPHLHYSVQVNGRSVNPADYIIE